MNHKPALSSRSPVLKVCIALLILLAVSLIGVNAIGRDKPAAPTARRTVFVGEYRIGEGEWQHIIEGQHIPATRGDVTLRGHFYLIAPDGTHSARVGLYTSIAFYLNHLNVTITESGGKPYTPSHETPEAGASGCGRAWERYILTFPQAEYVEIVVHNPHRFGNDAAIDDMLRNFYIWSAPDFEREIVAASALPQALSVLFFVSAVVMMGVALFASMIHVRRSNSIWFSGLTILCASGYFYFNADASFFQGNSVALITTVRDVCMMFYMLFLSGMITYSLRQMRRTGVILLAVLAAACALMLLISIFTQVLFFDLTLCWCLVQAVCSIGMIACQIAEYRHARHQHRWMHLALTLPCLAFIADMFSAAFSLWATGLTSQMVFCFLYIVAVFTVWRSIPQSTNAFLAAREAEAQNAILEAEKSVIEAELKESRVSIMLSQIRPHFIYNTLGTIERMCLKDPQKAFDLVRNFSLYLRANFGELGSVSPIRFAEEISHVKHYCYIEKTRFPDMEVSYDLQAMDFVLPALSVQPLVENAIKHGLMRLESGGTVNIRSWETETHYCVEVSDNGVGYDTSEPIDEKKHVGLRNIQGRLSAMVNGELAIESVPGQGTRATISIPKEENA